MKNKTIEQEVEELREKKLRQYKVEHIARLYDIISEENKKRIENIESINKKIEEIKKLNFLPSINDGSSYTYYN